MNEAEVKQYILDTFADVDSVENAGDTFFFYNPKDEPPDHKFPFVTLVTSDINDQFSNLNRPSVFRLNIGVSKQTFRALFGEPELPPYGSMALTPDTPSSYDFTALDQLLPHPVYGRMYWVCILNPSGATLQKQVHPLLAEAYEMAVTKRNRKAPHK